jgi:Pectate lyase superfamily protein
MPKVNTPMAPIYAINKPFYNVADYRVVGNGVTDDTAALQSTINAAPNGGVIYLPEGTYKITTPLTLSSANVMLLGAGGQGTVIQPDASFSGSQIILITADFCSVRDLTIAYANTTYSSNPAADGIQITGAKSALLENVNLNYINGWAVQSSATAGAANYWLQTQNVHAFQCKQGFHAVGVTGSSYAGSARLINCIMDQIQNGDAYLFEDCHDIQCTGLNGNVTAGAGNSLHVKGAVAAFYSSGHDLGPSTVGSGATILIESSTNGSPFQVDLSGGIAEGGLTGITISAGTLIRLRGMDVYNNGTHGINITGGDDILLDGCIFNLNGATAGASHYDLQSSTANKVRVTNCQFLTPQGTSAQQTANAMNITAGAVVIESNLITTSTPFNGLPSVIRANKGYNPVGNVSVSVPSSTVDFATKPSDLTYFVTGGTVTIIKIGGVATGLTGGSFRVPAQQTFNITYSVVPTVTAFSD